MSGAEQDLCEKSWWPCHHHAGEHKKCPGCGHIIRVISGFVLSGEWAKHNKRGFEVR